MNKHCIFLFSLIISQFVCAMDNSFYMNDQLSNQDRLSLYHREMRKYFNSLMPTGVRFISDENSGNLYETLDWKNAHYYTSDGNILTFHNKITNKYIECSSGFSLAYKGEKPTVKNFKNLQSQADQDKQTIQDIYLFLHK